jgi:small subunit ribosomal protein S6
MAEYEVAVLYDQGLEIDLEKATAKVEKIIADNGGKITNTDNWGKRKLAYPIKGQDFAIYVFYTVELPGVAVQKINDTLNITDEVVRFLITKPDLKKIAKAEALKAEKAEKAAARSESHDSDDSETESEE